VLLVKEETVTASFAGRYGPWAVIFGASEGIGASLARQVAAERVNLVMAARRPEPLDALADEVRRDCGVQAHTISVDLTNHDFLGDVVEITDGLDVGLMIWNAGATGSAAGGGHEAEMFLGTQFSYHLALVKLNCIGPVSASYHFAPHMRERGRGGILLVGSMAGMAGAALTVTYSASKAFEQVFAEGLWSELQPDGIDVLAIVAGATLTPAMERSGVVVDPNYPAMTSDEVAREGLDHIADGPVWVPGETNRAGFEYVRSLTRRDATTTMSVASRALWGRTD
jgi:short-subunit dehydrogenase